MEGVREEELKGGGLQKQRLNVLGDQHLYREVGEEARQGERLICDAGPTKPQQNQWGALEHVCPNV